MTTSRRRGMRLLCGAIALAAANAVISEAQGADVIISDFEPGGTYYGGTEAWFGYGAAGTGTGTPTGGTSNWFWAKPNQYYGSITNQSWANPEVNVNSFNSNSHLQFDLLVPTGGPDASLPSALTTLSIDFQFGGGSSGTVNQTLQTTFDSSLKNTVIPIDVS